MKKQFCEKRKTEKGQALIFMLGFLVLGGLTLVPLLAYTSIGLKEGQIYNEKMMVSYAADAGVELGLWNLTIGGLVVPTGEQVALPEFTTNNQTVNVTVNNLDNVTYIVTSVAVSGDGSSITINSYINALVGYTVASIDPDAITTIRQDAIINGDLYYAGDIEIIDSATVNGTVTQGDSFDIGIDPEEYKLEAQSGGTHFGDLTISDTPYALGPLYITGKLTINPDIDIILGGTVYVEKEIVINDGVTFTGEGNLLAANQDNRGKSIDIKKFVTINLDNIPLIMAASDVGEIKISDGANIAGLIYNTGGRIHFHASGPSFVYGALIGRGIRVCEDAVVTYNPDISKAAPFAWKTVSWRINPN